MLSCFGGLSRNRTTGYRLAKGEKLEDVVKDIGTVEGIPTLQVMMKVVDEQDKPQYFMIIK
jgi:glycerol-3-phosphate dehydrogenase